ncbi:hypothetical protein SAMN05216509_2563 [Pseudomonas sp. B10]|nr:hypothetical protein SAMN05216509_2563 [Pseudomonas sp. B10]
MDALRPKKRDAERHRMRYHAERGNDQSLQSTSRLKTYANHGEQ